MKYLLEHALRVAMATGRRLPAWIKVPIKKSLSFFKRPEASRLLDRSKVRWRGQEPDTGLTWGVIWDGSVFIQATQKRCSFTPSTSILEIGPGYGRLLDQILKDQLPFRSYLGLDLSGSRVERLREKYQGDSRIEFMCGDVETFELDRQFDLCISSATFVHLYPDCGKALRNLDKKMKSGAWLAFDVHPRSDSEDDGAIHGGFQPDGVTYARAYAARDIERLTTRTRFADLTTEHIKHGVSSDGADVICMFVCMHVI